jgi:hypothetical protein
VKKVLEAFTTNLKVEQGGSNASLSSECQQNTCLFVFDPPCIKIILTQEFKG